MEKIKKQLAQLKENNLYREIKDIEKIQGKYIYIKGEKYLDFSSSNYLGLRDNKEILLEAKNSLDKYGFGSGASRLVVGTCDLYQKLENKISLLKKQEKTLFFNSGYDANIGIISSLYGKDDIIFCDKLNHASIYDGIFLSGATLIRYKHNDMEDLEIKILKYRSKYKEALIVTDTIFSMDGDRADLLKLVELKEKYSLKLMIDEAHGGGVLGTNGGGLGEELDLLEKIDINMGTFSKAYGGQGAYVASSEEIIAYLINTCRSLIYTTSLPPSIVAGNLKAMELSEKEKGRREKLEYLGTYLRKKLIENSYNIGKSTSHIIPIIFKSNEEALNLSAYLFENGIIAPAIRKPTVIEPRLRISIGALLDKEDIDFLLELLLKFK